MGAPRRPRRPETAVAWAKRNGASTLSRNMASLSPEFAYEYAAVIDRAPSDVTRRGVLKSAYCSLMYAINVDKGPRDDTRMAACMEAAIAFKYAEVVDKGPRDDTRAAASKEPGFALAYMIMMDSRNFHPVTFAAVSGSDREPEYRSECVNAIPKRRGRPPKRRDATGNVEKKGASLFADFADMPDDDVEMSDDDVETPKRATKQNTAPSGNGKRRVAFVDFDDNPSGIVALPPRRRGRPPKLIVEVNEAKVSAVKAEARKPVAPKPAPRKPIDPNDVDVKWFVAAAMLDTNFDE